MSDLNFLEQYRNASIPVPDMDGVVLTCDLGPGLSEHDLPAGAPAQLRDFWRFTSGGPLLLDQQFGICGLSLNDPTRAREQASDRAASGYEVAESDWVLGEFVGDTDMLVIDEHGGVLVAAGSYPRRDWYRFDSLSALLEQYVQENAEKFWELKQPVTEPVDVDVDSYAMMIYRANTNLNLAALGAQIEYNTTPELQRLLTQATAAPNGPSAP